MDRLRKAIDHAAHLLPSQGPIGVFIHHNTLHAFENLPFHQAVRRGGETFGCEPYLSEARYRRELERGRITPDDLRAALSEDDNDKDLLGLCRRHELRMAMLQYAVWAGPVAELLWLLTETKTLYQVRTGVSAFARARFVTQTRHWVLRDLRGQHAPTWAAELIARFGASQIENWDDATWEAFALHALWRVCRDKTRPLPPRPAPPLPTARHRDTLLAATGKDTDVGVHDILIRFCAAFLDQGVSHWTLPDRSQGFYQSFLSLYRNGVPPDAWLAGLPAEAQRQQDATLTPLDSITESLQLLGVGEDEQEEFLSRTMLALRGWAGMISQVEQRSDAVARPIAEGTLVEFIAVRLLLDRLALTHAASEELGITGTLATLRDELTLRIPPAHAVTPEQRAFPVFKLAQVMGWSAEELHRLTPAKWATLVGEVEAFCQVERRRAFHLAYERRFRDRSLDALALHARYVPKTKDRPRFQVATCLDEREESFRRHLEEVAPDVETFSTAGFFGVAMYYRGASDSRFIPLCPIVVKPGHWVEEQVSDAHEHEHRRNARARQLVGEVTHRMQVGSRSMAAGAALSGLGALAAIPLIARILFPSLTAQIGRLVDQPIRTPKATRLKIERTESSNGQAGYTVDEMAGIAERLMREIGLTTAFSRLFIVLGHGSDSVNNPHKSAYDCGACGGSPGAANGRAFAQMLNDPRVRERLVKVGIEIPADTWFVGGFHDTCDDSVILFDLDRVPETHCDELARVQEDFVRTCQRNAHERCRRFMSARLDMSPDEAHRHVENRQEDLAQPRPELGHATNALCLVSRRIRTRGLYLDRRAFLTSYDPTIDDANGTILARILAAAVPVCAGINLEYYFSHVDNQGYGCGSKLPHNLTGLLGVMDGAASDLRTGLPWQMVEIHEPVRLLFVVETTPEIMLSIMDRNPVIGTHVRNGWVQMAVQDPESDQIQLYRDGEFRPYLPTASQLPEAASSIDWYRGWRDHLEFAEINSSVAAGGN